jgi:histidine triad (HIT) family protein
VPHTHIHLVPINSISDLNFKNPKLKMTPEEFEKTALRIREKVIL